MPTSFPLPPRPAGNVDGTHIRKQERFVAAVRVVLGLFIVSIFLWFAWIIHSFNRWKSVENRDPSEVFKHVFNAPPPAGVIEIKAAGEQPFDGNYWMVVRTTDISTLITVVTRKAKPANRDNLWLYEPRVEQLKRQAASVGWEAAHHVKNPEYYELASTQGTGYVVIVDRSRKCIYVGVYVS